MATLIPQDWFDKDHEMHRLAWFLYENEETVPQQFLHELLQLLEDVDDASLIAVGGYKTRQEEVDPIPNRTPVELELHKLATQRVLEMGQRRFLKEREAKRKLQKEQDEKSPLLAMVGDKKDAPDEDAPLSSSLYDYYDVDRARELIEQMKFILKRDEGWADKLAAEQKELAKKAEKPKKKKPAKKADEPKKKAKSKSKKPAKRQKKAE